MSDRRLFLAAAETILRKVQSGDWGSEGRLPSERRIAQDLELSRPTVRKAIDVLIRQGVVERKPNCRPRIVPLSQPSVVATDQEYHVFVLLFPHVADFAFAPILRGVQRVGLPGKGKLVAVCSGVGPWRTAIEFESRQLRSIARDPAARGVIIWYVGGAQNRPYLQELEEAKIPMVFVDRRPPRGILADYVGSDNLGATRRIIGHLYDIGHRRIACISNGEPVSSVEERVRGYQSGMEMCGLAPSGSWYQVLDPSETTEVATTNAVRKLIASENPPTAIFCTNDMVGGLTIEALARMGVEVPRVMSVVGFDGGYRYAPGPTLSTALQQFDRIGETAHELLRERMFGLAEQRSFQSVLIDAPFHDLGSVAPPLRKA